VALSECLGREPNVPLLVWLPVCSWRRGPWPLSRLIGPFERVEIQRRESRLSRYC
jgi:hypothetical protein